MDGLGAERGLAELVSDLAHPFEMRVHRDRETTVVVLLGEFDLAAEAQFAEGMAAINGPPTVLLDLRELQFMDSTGIRMILELERKLSAEGASLGVYLAGGQVQRLFEIVGLNGPLVREAPTTGAETG
jgi:anti-sigma B factor antagonist